MIISIIIIIIIIKVCNFLCSFSYLHFDDFVFLQNVVLQFMVWLLEGVVFLSFYLFFSLLIWFFFWLTRYLVVCCFVLHVWVFAFLLFFASCKQFNDQIKESIFHIKFAIHRVVGSWGGELLRNVRERRTMDVGLGGPVGGFFQNA